MKSPASIGTYLARRATLSIVHILERCYHNSPLPFASNCPHPIVFASPLLSIVFGSGHIKGREAQKLHQLTESPTAGQTMQTPSSPHRFRFSDHDDFEHLRPQTPPNDLARRRDDFLRIGAFDLLLMQRGLEAMEREARRDRHNDSPSACR